MSLINLIAIILSGFMTVACATSHGSTYEAIIDIVSSEAGFFVAVTNPHTKTLCVPAGTFPGPKGFVSASSDAPQLHRNGNKYNYDKMWSGFAYNADPDEVEPGKTVQFFFKRGDFEPAPQSAELSYDVEFYSCRGLM